MASLTGWRGRNPVLGTAVVPPDPAESRMARVSPLSSRPASFRAERARPVALVPATSAGTNLLASTVPQPLATSNPGAAVKPGTRTLPVLGSITELFPLTTSERPAWVPSGPRTSYSTGWTGPSLLPSVLLTFGTVPPTAVTHGLSSQVAVSGPALVLPHCALATARFCTTPQSPVAFVTGMPAAAAASGPGSLAWICAVPKA